VCVNAAVEINVLDYKVAVWRRAAHTQCEWGFSNVYSQLIINRIS